MGFAPLPTLRYGPRKRLNQPLPVFEVACEGVWVLIEKKRAYGPLIDSGGRVEIHSKPPAIASSSVSKHWFWNMWTLF